MARAWYQGLRDDDAITYAAALAFHAVLALFPFVAVLVALLGFLHIPQVFDGLRGWAEQTLPSSSASQLDQVIGEVTQRHRGGVLSFGLLGAVWAASGGVRSAMRALNQAYDVDDGRTAWRRYAVSVAYTVGLAVLALLAGVLLFIGPSLVADLADTVGLGDAVVSVWRWLRYPVAIAMLMVSASVFYTVLPKLDRFRLLTPGSIVAVLLWLLVSWLFRLYVANFGRYNAVYGSLGAFIVLLLYAWICALVLLTGAELNAVLHRRGRGRASETSRTLARGRAAT